MPAPLTPFETSGYLTKTTLSEGDSFLDTVISETGRVTKILLGQSQQGRPIHVFLVGGSSPPSPSSVQDSLVCICSQHGQEWTPREAGLSLIRDFAYSSDAGLITSLDSNPIVVLPTANPDGFVATSRWLSNGDDLNRAHLALLVPEALAINKLFRSFSPVMIYDGHQWGGATENVNVTMFEPASAYPLLRQYGADMLDEISNWFPEYSIGLYELASHEGTLTSAWTLRGIAGVLVESRSASSREIQHDVHLRMMKGLHSYVASHQASLVSLRSEVRSAVVEEALTGSALVPLYENGFVPPAMGYFTNEDSHNKLTLHGIEYHPNADGLGRTYVPAAQPMGSLIPPLLDPRGPRSMYPSEIVYEGTGYGGAGQKSLYTSEDYKINIDGRVVRPRRLVFNGEIIWEV